NLHSVLKSLERVRIVVLIPIRKPEGNTELGIVGVPPDGSFDLIWRLRRLVSLLGSGGRRKSDCQNCGKAARDRLFAAHWSGSVRRSCKREFSASSLRSALAISSRLSASSFLPMRVNNSPSW